MIQQNFIKLYEKSFSENWELPALSDYNTEVLYTYGEIARQIARMHLLYEQIGIRKGDKIAVFGGSWKFILVFGSVLLIWIIVNTAVLLWKPFDPYPFILLNLILSCLAAIQAPVIMMSQNRQEAKDRLRSKHDYRVNLKAELEIRHLHEKIDHLMSHQWERLVEIQQIQIELMSEITRIKGRRKDS